jgi:hypothetical protein
MQKLVLVLAILIVLVFPAFAQKERGALEGTIMDQNGTLLRSCGCIIIERVGYVGPSVNRWELRTDKMGHFFFNRFPVGTYSLKVVSRDGRILKQISDVRVEVGRVQNLDSALGGVTLTLPLSETKKPKQSPLPTQPDIVRGCITIRNITFQRARLILLNSNLGVSGWIENNCGRDAYVRIEASFFGANGDKIREDVTEKLVRTQGVDFRIQPDRLARDVYPEVVYSSDGRVTDVWVRFQP